ncbi:MAG: response regulator [Pseudomonadota bacterium]
METPQSLINKSILIIDDQSSILNLTRSYLTHAGFKNLTTCTESALAIKILEEKSFDLIICDWNMPKYDGLDVLAVAKKNEKHTGKFLMMTSNSETPKVKTAIQSGVDGYLIKPFQIGKLVNWTLKLLKPTPQNAVKKVSNGTQ